MDLELNDVHVLVTGASGGIGLEISRLFLEQGAKVTAHYNTNKDSLQALLTHFGPDRVQVLQANLIIESAVEALFSAASSTAFGPVQVLILNHGIWPYIPEPIWKLSLDRWKHTIDTNLTSSFIVAKEYLKRLQGASVTAKEKASIVLIGSSSGKIGEAGHADYASSKSAMMYGLTLSLKNEIVKIAPRGRVNSVAPGWVLTPMVEDAMKNPAIVYQALADRKSVV